MATGSNDLCVDAPPYCVGSWYHYCHDKGLEMLNKQFIKEVWVPALRSGKFTQGKCRLKFVEVKTSIVTHCCLGVACEIGENLTGVTSSIEPFWGFYSWDGETQNLPESIAKFIDITVSGQFTRKFIRDHDLPYSRVSLVNLNDGYNYSFSAIADLIDAAADEDGFVPFDEDEFFQADPLTSES